MKIFGRYLILILRKVIFELQNLELKYKLKKNYISCFNIKYLILFFVN